MIQSLRGSLIRNTAGIYAGLFGFLFLSAAMSRAADGDAELTVNGTVNTITDTEVFTGELYPLTVGDIGYESTAHRNAVVVTGGGELKLSAGADVWIKNDNDHTTFLRVGYGSGTSGDGTLTIESGATLRVGSATRYANFQLGQGGGVIGTVNQTGGDATFIGSLNVGVNGGTGVYNVSGGTVTFDNAGPLASNRTSLISIGFNNSISGTSSGTFNISGGLVQVAAPHDGGAINFIIGNAALNALQAYSGTSTNDGNAGAGNGTVTQTGGTFRIGSGGALYLSAYGNGVYNLSGGTLEIGGASLQSQYGNHSEYTNAFNLGGGTIKVIDSDLITSVSAKLVAGATSMIDTNGLNATWSGNLVGAGLHQIDFGGSGLVKTGAGTLTFGGTSGTTRALDTFAVTGGTLAQTAGATSAVEFMVGSGSGSTATYSMSGGTLAINDSTRADNTTAVAGSFRVGDFGGTGTFNQNAGTVNVSGSLNVGNQGGQGTYNLSGGTLNLNGGLSTMGRTSGSTVSSGGSTGLMTVSGTGTLNINSGAEFVLSNWYPSSGITQGTGTLTQTGGVITVANTASLTLTGNGTGTYNLNGGTLQIGGGSLLGVFGGQAGTYHFNLGGGTIQVTGTDLATSVDANLVGGTTSVINTNGLNATWSGDLAGAGLHQIDFGGSALVKTGAGTLTFGGTSGTTRALDTFAVTGGSVAQTAGDTSAVEFMVGTGTGSTGAFVMNGGTLTINPSTRTDNTTAVAGSFRVGDFGGTGTITQNAGTITVSDNGALNVGNQGGTGTYNLTGGTLSLNAGNHVVGRSTSGKPASTGTLNVSGGSLVIDNGGHLILGNNIEDPGTLFGAGTLTQTGGTIRITDGGLYVGASGNGTYNLFGGTLEVAGAGLLGRYGSGAAAGVSTFNFGMGTIKVIDSDLTTSLNANLVGGILSTIDTNGFNATWSGNLTGTGTHQVDAGGNALAKIGAGTLYLSGATRTLDTFAAAAGTTRQTTGATTVGEFMVGTGAGSTATFEMAGGTLFVDSSLAADNTTHVAGSFRVGDFTGAGTFTQTGGTVTVGSTGDGELLIGREGGSGAYALSGGTLKLSGGRSALSRSNATHAASAASLTLSGAGTLLELVNGASLVIGNDVSSGGATGSATLTQTGGTLRVTDGTLYVAGYGAGTYNLNGGTLEVGGDGLAARYGTSEATSTFNFGTATLKVIGSNLVTDVQAVLANGAVSTINTNGFNATLSGAITGQGGLTKTGAGTLHLTGASDYSGATTVSTGTLRIDGTLANTGISVASGATFSGHGTVQDLSILGGGNLVQGGTTGNLSVTGDLTMAATSYTLLGLAGASSYDTITVDGTLFAGGVLDVQALNGYDPLTGATFDLFDGTFSGTFAEVRLPTLVSGLEWNTSGLYTSGVISVVTSPIPEPATWAVILGAVALGAGFCRRRRRSAE